MVYRSIKFVLLCTVAAVFVSANANSAFKGDVNQDCELDLQDAILSLQVITGIAPTIPVIVPDIDVNEDGKIGQAEVIHVLQALQNNYVVSACRIWMDRNLGASRIAINSTDPDAFGDLYQWGRLADGHQSRDSSTTTNLSLDVDDPGYDDFILAPDSPFDWRDPQNNDLWQDVSGTNNPCPSGFRLPTEEELDDERQSWGSNDPAGAFGSPLKLVMAGSRDGYLGTILGTGVWGFYWSSTIRLGGSDSSVGLFVSSDDAVVNGHGRANGYSVRCIMD